MPENAILFVTPEPPYPVLGGGAQRIASLVEYALDRGFAVDLLNFGRCQPPPGLFRNVWELELPANNRSTAARVARNAARLIRGIPPLVDRLSGQSDRIRTAIGNRKYHAVFLEHFWLAPYVDLFKSYADRVYCDLHNIESCFFTSLAESNSWPANWAHQRFAGLSVQLERRYLPRFDAALVTSDADADAVESIVPGLRVAVFPNTIPWFELPHAEPHHAIVFSGNLEYHPNQQAVRWFAREVWPALREDPGLEWKLVGMNAEAVADVWSGDSRIRATGLVEDAMGEIASTKAAVVPLLSGSGTRVKILEAWAAGRPVVSTAIGAHGLPAKDGEHLIIANTSEELVQATRRVLQDQSLARAIARAGRLLYEHRFHRQAAWKLLDENKILL